MGCVYTKREVQKMKNQNSNLKPESNIVITKEKENGVKKHDESSKSFNEQSIKINTGQFILENKRKVEDFYKILSLIGKGSYGSIYKVQHKTSKLFRAMKIIKKSCLMMQDDDQKFLKEIEILIGTDHPNIIKIYEYFVDNINFIIITEYIGGGDLYNSITKFKKFSEEIAATIMYQIFSAVCYLHSKNIVHRDIKPENILVESWSLKQNDISLKMIDFGTSNYFSKDNKMSLKIGSPYYIAPEVIRNEYNEKCDIWSCGVLMYILITGKPPFYGNSVEQIMEHVSVGKADMSDKLFHNVSGMAKKLIEQLLTYDYKKRISAEDALQSEWIKTFYNNHQKNEINDREAKEILENIKSFNAQEKLQHATIAYIVHFIGASEEVKSLKKLFKTMDSSGDGRLSYDELRQGFEKIFGSNITDVELEKIISDIDQDNNGFIEYEEFLRLALNKNTLLSQNNLKIAFENFDENNDGSLSINEIKRVLGTASNDYFEELIQRIDQDGNKEISFEEFSDLMTSIIKDKMPISKKTTEIMKKKNNRTAEQQDTGKDSDFTASGTGPEK